MSQLNIKIQVLNSEQSNVIYAGEANKFAIQLVNKTGSDLAITGGDPQNPPPPGGASALLLDFSQLFLKPGDQFQLSVSSDGWAAQAFKEGQFPAWVLASKTSFVWANNSPLDFQIENLNPTAPLGTVYLSSSLFNFGTDTESDYSTQVMICNPPSKDKDLTLYMKATVSINPPSGDQSKSTLPSFIGVTKNPVEPLANSIELIFSNNSASQGLVPSGTPWEKEAPQFIVSFIPASDAPGYNALATPSDINAFSCDISGGTSGWKAPQKSASSPATWTLEPDPVSNHAILGTGTEAIASFTIGNVITDFINGPTIMYVQYINIPGYSDGFFSALLTKDYVPMSIDSFSITPQQIVIGPDPNYKAQSVFLNWSVSNSTYVEISGHGQVPSSGASLELPVISNSSFVLTAIDMITGNILTKNVNIGFNLPISTRWQPIGSIAMWKGDAASIPMGWVLCDGTNNTPDLRDFFIVGATGQFAVLTSNPLPTHEHKLSYYSIHGGCSWSGTHNHSLPAGWYTRTLTCGDWSSFISNSDPNAAVQDDSKGHYHDVVIDFSGKYTAPNTTPLLPDWFALCFIMKTSN